MFASRRPEKNRRGRFWEWLNPGLGKELKAWLVGTPIGVETHWLGRTQPCRRYLTGGLMECYCSTSKLTAEWKGFVPLLDENGVQCFAVIGERYQELAWSIPLFAPVTVSRLRSSGSPVCVKQSDWTANPPPSHGTELKAKDLRPWLLKLWKDEVLNEWFAANGNQTDEQVKAPLFTASAGAKESLTLDPKEPAKPPSRGKSRLPGMENTETITAVIGHMPGQNGKRGR